MADEGKGESMSSRDYKSEQSNLRLPPIGFEGTEEKPVKPLKVKKRRSKDKLKAAAIASQSFNSGRSRHNTGSSVTPRSLQRDYDYDVVGDVKLRRNLTVSRSERRSPKTFTISDLETLQSPQYRNYSKRHREMSGDNTAKGVQNFNGRNISGKELKDILRKLYTARERDRIDYVVLHKVPQKPDSADEKQKHIKRQRFEKLLEDEGFKLEHETIDGTVYCKLHCTFARLCKEAERVKLEMPLKSMEIDSDEEDNCCTTWIENTFATDDEVDYVSAPFEQVKLHLFENCGDPDLFFRSSLRGLLVDHCLKNLDMRKLPETPQYYYHEDQDDDPQKDILSKQGLPFLLMKKVYDDAFILHDESTDNFKESQKFAEEDDDKNEDDRPDSAAIHTADGWAEEDRKMQKVLDIYGDARHDLNVTWPNVLKFQPLWKIRNYFGEEIALYFAWIGLMIVTLSIPMLIGLGVFGYGLYCSVSDNCDTSTTGNGTGLALSSDSLVDSSLALLDAIKEAFDNNATPWYAVSVCIWSTVFLELWKRKNAVLAYEWDVNNFDDVEPDRPSYFGTDTRKDPITKEPIPFYPFKYKCIKYTISIATFLFMVCVVFAIAMGVIAYRLVINVNYCGDWNKTSPAYCFIVTTICSSLLNALFILILGKIYEVLAVKLTHWENHRTPSQFRNALIIKLFAFQFANCYTSLYYIAFFRSQKFTNGILNLGEAYNDTCGNSCMPELSFQVFTLMFIKPLPRILKDVIVPYVKKKLKLCCKSSSSVKPEKTQNALKDMRTRFLQTEKNKPALTDFTLNEYTEKILQYGFIVLFAAAMPLGPLIAVLVNTLDRVVDSKRILWMYRRPVANIAQDIGVWYNILEFLNIAGVITNAFLIAYVSDWGVDTFAPYGNQLWAVLVFEHAVFLLKYALDIAIPDVPHKIRIAIRKEKFTVAKILETGMFVKGIGANSDKRSPTHRLSPEGGQRGGSAADTVTATNVQVDTTDASRHRQHMPVSQRPSSDYSFMGDIEPSSPRKGRVPASPSPVSAPPPPQYTLPTYAPSTAAPAASTNQPKVKLDYGAGGDTYLSH